MKADSQAAKAYNEIRKKILVNQLKPGLRLKEDIWSKNVGVSRVAIREALTRLLGESLVMQGEKGGFYVRGLTKDEVQEIRELREVLELGAIRLSLKKLTTENIKSLEKICDDFTSMIERGYFNGACEADMKFHEMLIKLSGNKKLFNAYFASHIPLFHQKLTETQETLNDYELTDKEHRAIVAALKAKNYRKAEDALIKHISRGESAILDL
ncbi:MAG: GntR family transcriptional regulator [Bacteroidota bacterium]|nr:MAG: GntR family transcriptional regulator [Bacteroidota bacterium]HNR73700.1 GntR family transcriptional regulator [Cyclobacteriaceae bacterium]